MPTVPPTFSDWYIVVPLPDATKTGAGVAAQVFVVGANDMDDAAQWAHDRGFPVAAVVLATRYKTS